jgi:hypothetical protein
MTRVFEELKATDCRWPLAEFDRGEFLFCGEPIKKYRSLVAYIRFG